ncbi:uncharacterized protein CEXT_92371 [Caerostris extrusa]|uniref:Uncharacterized protein n=1 Tax=Caerostris extrusa TaxID=172846 RepID=A0AAV4RE99_CAEEX|nr:uncharacterized protein CEXT_92371 [Caerostris extrusa]
MLRGIFLFSCLLGAAFAANSANQYIDNVLQTSLGRELQNYGLIPARLANFSTSIGASGVYRNVGVAVFSNGNGTGFDRIKRKGDCSGPRNVRGEITINCTLSVFPIVTAYKTTIKNGSHVYYAANQGHVGETLLRLEVAGRPQNYIGFVKSFSVQSLGQITSTFSQLPPAFAKYLKVLQDAHRTNVTTQLFNLLNRNYASAMGRALANKPMPRQ